MRAKDTDTNPEISSKDSLVKSIRTLSFFSNYTSGKSMNPDYINILTLNTPQRSAVKSSFIQKCISFGSEKKGLSFNDSNTSTNDVSRDLSLTVYVPRIHYPIMNINVEENDNDAAEMTELKQKSLTNVTRGEFDTTIFMDIASGSHVIDSMYQDFLSFYQSYSGEQDAFDLLLNYEEICCSKFAAVSKVLMSSTCTDMNFSKLSAQLESLQMERNTWRLLRILVQDRLEAESADEGDILMSTLGKMTDKQIVDNLYNRNAYIRQCQLIVDWLEKNCEEDFQCTIFDKFQYFTDRCMSLEHSLNELITSNFNQNQMGLREIDPDAPFRDESYPLHEADKENESRLFKFMFMCIRTGKLDEAQQLAERFGEPWLAAALEGWRLFHDPNYENELIEGQELFPVEGNKYRDLWKAACWEASQAPVIQIHEQALYGSLCGNLKAVLSVCKTWSDYLWAYTRTSLDKLIEQEIRNLTQQDRTVVDLPVDYWDKVLDLEEIFQELAASNSNEVRSESKKHHHIIQKYVILDDIGGLIEEMYSWLNNSPLDSQILRCMAHIILFLRLVGRSTKEELCVPILEAYVQELIKSNKIYLVAPYCSTLPKEQQIIWYSKFLEGITDNDERQKCLQYGEDAGLDVSQITKTVVRNIREKDSEKIEAVSDLTAATTEEDLKKIHAIDWLIFNPTQRAEALKQANALMRMFVVQRKMDAAKLLFSKIPQDSVAVMIQLAKAKGLDELSADDDNSTREYLCFKAYLEAMEAFDSWFHHSIHAKPKEPPAPTGDHITFKEKVAYEHEMQQHEKDLERWQSVVSNLASSALDCLYNVLLFVDGGWMIDQRTNGTTDENRQLQLSHLRKLCLPHVTRLLQDLLQSENKFKEAIQLVDIISSEKYQLYKVFTQEDIKQMLRVNVDVSFDLLDKNLDPLGYNCE
ncbi:nuclear pore complex protein Nup107 [Nephila pilipes]|uniref:Nuclear pore complex protein n=1 Tax=Nephila pilipes TaxID=299642 RepID=A0A8X6N7G8_NEPPI|nr:nuclear pore complex protein Nup107 [Nephila pilipes]